MGGRIQGLDKVSGVCLDGIADTFGAVSRIGNLFLSSKSKDTASHKCTNPHRRTVP